MARDIHDEGNFLYSDAASAPPAAPLYNPPASGIGLDAPSTRQQVETDLRGSGGLSQLGFALESFGAGILGRPQPMDRMIAQKEADKRTKLAEAKVNQDALEDSAKWYERLPEGPERDKFVATRVGQLNQQSPGLGDQFKAFTAKPSLVTRFREYEEFLPDHLKLMLRTDPEGFRRAMATTEGMKALSEANDRRVLRLATKKGETAIMGWQKFAPPDVVTNYTKDGIITFTEFKDAQQYLPKEARMSDEEMEVAARTPGFWKALNIVGPDDEAAVQKKRLEDPAPKTRTFTRGTKEVTEEYRDGKWVKVGEGEKFKPNDPDADRRRDRDIELKLSDDYARDTKGFKELKASFAATTDYMTKVVGDPKKSTSAGDRALIFAYAKMLDPGDKVAVKDIQDIEKLGGVPDRIIQGVKALAIGKELPEGVRADMYQEIKSRFKELNKQQRGIERDYTDRAGRYKLDSRNVVRPMALAGADEVGDVITRGGKQYKIVKLDPGGDHEVEEVKR